MEVCGPQSLNVFWEKAEEITQVESLVPVLAAAAHPPKVEASPALPVPGTTLLIFFAGKGGVGKTTLACATAIRLASDFQGRKILLFSIDPAHSLSACLGMRVGPAPARVCPGLEAMEMDPQTEFDALKQQYAKELEEFLQSLLPNMDLTFDREVMEKILDLSPPGLDEIMALNRVMEFLERHEYDMIIIDSAPTGHLIRLLELPELIDSWLKAFFGLFLKYKQVFRLPKISQRFVEMSKDLKHLRALLKDPARSVLYAVAILTEMALQETKDLVTTCERMGVNVGALFLNLATFPTECPLCLALYKRESAVWDEFYRAFPNKHQTLIYRWGEPRGLDQLAKLGDALYDAPAGSRRHG